MNTSKQLTLQESIKMLSEMTLLDRFLYKLKKIHACVNRIKASEEAGVKFMRKWIERMELLEEGRLSALLGVLRKLMQEQHMTADEAMNFLEIPEAERETYLEKCKQYNDTLN